MKGWLKQNDLIVGYRYDTYTSLASKARDLFKGHVIISGRFTIAMRIAGKIKHVIKSLFISTNFFVHWTIAIKIIAINAIAINYRAFFAHFALDVIVGCLIVITYEYIHICIVGINRAKRGALLLLGSQFLYLDNQWWAHLRQCSTVLLDGKVRVHT